MTVYATPFEGTAGQALAQANHGGSAFSAAPTGAHTFSTAAKAHGNTGVATTTNGVAYYDLIGGSTAGFSRLYFQVPSAIGVDTTLLTFYHVGGTSIAGRLIINSANRLRLTTTGSGTTTTRWTAAAALTTSSIYRAQVRFTAGTTANTGGVEVSYASLDSATPVEPKFSLSGIDTAGTSGTISQIRLHMNTTVMVDDFAAADGADSAWIDQWVPLLPPVVSKTTADGWYEADYRPTGATTYSIVHTSGPNNVSTVKEYVEGLFYVKQDSSASSTYTVTATGPGGSSTDVLTVPPVASGSSLGMEYLYCDGSTWV